MTKTERRIEELERKVRELEARPTIIVQPIQVTPAPAPQPYPHWPWWQTTPITQPYNPTWYVGDPVSPGFTISGGNTTGGVTGTITNAAVETTFSM